ncbi:MAG: hypothetical protein K9J06_15990 [Flavobacteriales bacterium]|nr:hypothetical protein [Flavobacteriales bacterium]
MQLKHLLAPLLICSSVALLPSCAKKGCTDPDALNYYADAEEDDGSCVFFDRNHPSLPISLAGVYYEPVTLYNFNDVNDSTGIMTYDYVVNTSCSFYGGLVVEPGVRILVGHGKSITLSEGKQHRLLGTAADPVIIDGALGHANGEEKIVLNGVCEFRHVHMTDLHPHLMKIDSLLFSDNIVVKAEHGFDFTYQYYTGIGVTYMTPRVFVNEFDRNVFSQIAELDALIIPVSMLSGMGRSNEFDLAPNQYVHVGSTGSSSHPLEGDHVWEDIGAVIRMGLFEIGDGFNASGSLTINEGVKLRMTNQYYQVQVRPSSKLIINGTEANPVELSAWEGYNWGGIDFEFNSSGNSIQHAVISKGGYSGGAAIGIGSSCQLAVSNTLIRDSQGCGVRVTGNGQYNVGANVTYSGNAGGNVCN